MFSKIFSLTTLAVLLCFAAAAQNEIVVPGFTSYKNLNPKTGEEIPNQSRLKIFWFGDIKQTGEINCAIKLNLSADETAKLRLTVAGKFAEASVTGSIKSPITISFGSFDITNAGYQKFTLESLDNKNIERDDIDSLIVGGGAAADAHFNLKSRRNAASVHLAYPTPGITNIDAFYCEVTAMETPVWTYFEACGWHRGYFGMQVNSATERRIIFSVWDSGGEAVSRNKVSAADRVTLVAKGDGVYTGDFGNEGTGGHSHLVYDWKTGEKQRFLVTAKPTDATHTTYAGYWFQPEQKKWLLISSWNAPKDGAYLRGLYSFCENFGGDNGYLHRRAFYGNQWFHTADGQWHEQTTATFSHDPTGKSDRLDRFMGVENGQFFLSTGGFISGFTRFGELFTRPATGQPPTDFNFSLFSQN
jgi:hypothetical protein